MFVFDSNDAMRQNEQVTSPKTLNPRWWYTNSPPPHRSEFLKPHQNIAAKERAAKARYHHQ